MLQGEQRIRTRGEAELQRRRQALLEGQAGFGQPRGVHRGDWRAGSPTSGEGNPDYCQGKQSQEKEGAVWQNFGAGQGGEDDIKGQRGNKSAHAAAYPSMIADARGDQGQRFAQRVLMLRTPACLQCRHAPPPFLKIGLLYQDGGCFGDADAFGRGGPKAAR